jgi:hypothetical protein
MSKLQIISEILNGWGNQIKDEFGILEPQIKKEAEKRLLICNTCPLRSKNSCSGSLKGKAVKNFVYQTQIREKGVEYYGCGCNLAAKTKSPLSDCPLGKW